MQHPPTPPTTFGGPVSDAIEADLRTWVRKHGIVLWFDADAHYTDLVDRLAAARTHAALPYDVFAFRGSYLELSMQLEPLVGGVVPKPLVVHLPGFNEQTVRTSPLFELHLAGARYRKALDTAVTEAAAGRVHPDAIEAFKTDTALSLSTADQWLHDQLAGVGTGLAGQLRSMSLVFVLDDLLGNGSVAKKLVNEQARELAATQLAVQSGMPDAWRSAILPSAGVPSVPDIAFVTAAWALSVEYVDDLTRPPVDPRIFSAAKLPDKVIASCRELAQHLRARHPAFYRRTADDTESLLDQETANAQATDLGKIDTFRFEEQSVLLAALVALGEQRWDAAAEWADHRLNGGSFWLSDSPERKNTWLLVQQAAAVGQAVIAAGPDLKAKDLPGAIERYTTAGAPVDQAHRHLEQRREELLYHLLPAYETLRVRLDSVRGVWRRWADRWAVQFNALCRTEGFLPPAELQQRNLFDDIVRPFAQATGITAYFVVDALRYEMGEELYRAIATMPAATVKLDARLAELPTVTEVGMNVLAPVAADGRLRPSLNQDRFDGFSTGEYLVHNPKTRLRAKHERVGGNRCPLVKLDEVVSRDRASLMNTVRGASLVVVHSEEIDNAGEKGQGPNVFGTVMHKLRAAWRLLHEVGVQRFVFTADHGFLLLAGQSDNKQSHGANKLVPKRRYTISTIAADHTGEARVSFADLKYDGVEGQLMMPESTNVFDTGDRPMSFVHGGNSLQERVIPVLTVVHRAKAGATTIRYELTAEASDGVGGMHCMVGTVAVVAQGSLDFGGAKEVELALRVREPADTIVELCQARYAGRLVNGSLLAKVGAQFELFFRLTGATETRALVELYHPSAAEEVKPCPLDRRFEVTLAVLQPSAPPVASAPAVAEPPASRDWLDDLPEGGVRQLFAHLAMHGAVTESEAASMLGGMRELRRFSRDFEAHAKRAPFAVRIQVVAGVKRYSKEGSNS